jgi:hypothetical protein
VSVDIHRNPRDYFAIFDKAELVSADGSSSEHFQLINCKCVDTYVTVKKNQNQICWKFRKVRASLEGRRLQADFRVHDCHDWGLNPDRAATHVHPSNWRYSIVSFCLSWCLDAGQDQESSLNAIGVVLGVLVVWCVEACHILICPKLTEIVCFACYVLSATQVLTPHPRPGLYRTFLDTQQYSDTSIAQYERVFGRGFISPGGEEASATLLQQLQLTPGVRVLDVGCGIGGE